MYNGFFGLAHAPFSIAPDPRYLYLSERHREALAHLSYGLSAGGGFVLLTGEIGAGKTTVCRSLLEQVPKRCNVAYIFNPKLTAVELLKSVCREFHVDAAHTEQPPTTLADHIDALNEYLLRTHAVGQSNVLIIDEAQSLSADVLEQLRLLTNLETNERKLLQIILIGQPELRDLLAQPELEQLAQRVIARYHLEALSPQETVHYIAHRLVVAGASGPLPFDPPALKRIHALTRGVPRRINVLCDRALLGAYARGVRPVNRRIVTQAASEVFGEPATAWRWHPAWAPTLRRRWWVLAGLAPLVGAAIALPWMLRVAGGKPWPALAALQAAAPSAASAPPPVAPTARSSGGPPPAAHTSPSGAVAAHKSRVGAAAPAARTAPTAGPASAGSAALPKPGLQEP
jgi:general secretion pathway protein A